MASTIQTQLGNLVVRKAEPSEKAMVLAIKQDAARWLEAKGIHQWAGILMAQGEDFVHKPVQEGEAYLALKDDLPIGTITLTWEDAVSWGEKGKDGKAGYLHGMAVLRKYAGKEIGKNLLNWAMGAIRAKGKIIRLDCMAENPRINRYYTDLQFESKGQATLASGFKVSLYEKK